MAYRSLSVRSKYDLHARPAAEFVRTANQFVSVIVVRNQDKAANGKSITGVLSLGVSEGCEVEITAEGTDAEEAVRQLSKLLNQEELAMHSSGSM